MACVGAMLSLLTATGVAHASGISACDSFLLKESSSKSGRRLNVIVRFRGKPSAEDLQQLKRIGFAGCRRLDIINAEAGAVRADKLKRLLRLPFVSHVSEDVPTQKTDAFTSGSTYAPQAWQQYQSVGAGVGVAVLDTGISDISDFHSLPGLLGIVPVGDRICGSVDFTGEGLSDGCGHGTHVAGLIAGDAANSNGLLYKQSFLGIAPGCNLYSVKVLDHTGSGLVSNVIAGVQWVVQNRTKFNLRVINMSMGHPVGESYETDPLCQAVESAWKSGVTVVCAAGNDGRLSNATSGSANNSGYGTNYWSVEAPGNDPYVITVGATKSMDGARADDRIASYSSRGPSRLDFILKPDIIAPGNLVVSTEDVGSSYLVKTYGSQIEILNSSYMLLGLGYSKSYFRLSGTSMATPVVSGSVALMLANQPGLTPDTVKARLMISADKWADPAGLGDPCTYGAGYLNIPAAMGCTAVAATYALSPTLSEDGLGNVFANLDPAIYGQRAMWGTGATTTDIYGQRAMWGKSGNQLTDSRAMWGKTGWADTSTSVQSTSSVGFSTSPVIVQGE